LDACILQLLARKYGILCSGNITAIPEIKKNMMKKIEGSFPVIAGSPTDRVIPDRMIISGMMIARLVAPVGVQERWAVLIASCSSAAFF